MEKGTLAMIAAATALASAPAEPFRLPVPLVWQVDSRTLSRRQYLKDIDYLR